MKLKKKQCLLLCSICLVLVILVILVYLIFKFNWFGTGSSNNNSLNLNQSNLNINSGEKDSDYIKIEGTKQVGNIEFSNIRIRLLTENKCEFVADVKNTSTEFLESTNIRIKVIDKSGETQEIFGGVLTELAGYEPGSFKTYVLADITDAIDIEFEIIK